MATAKERDQPPSQRQAHESRVAPAEGAKGRRQEQQEGARRAPADRGGGGTRGASSTARRTTTRFVPGDWRGLPDFCDRTAALSAATYGARRLPEIRALYRQSTPFGAKEGLDEDDDEEGGGGGGDGSGRTLGDTLVDSLRSGGGRTSNRHLRRRATSHLSRKRHRFPAAGFEEAAVLSPPEGTKNGDGERPSLGADSAEGGMSNSDLSNASRRKRRRKRESICRGHDSWWKGSAPGGEPSHCEASERAAGAGQSSIEESTSKAHWIPTHLWHTKRFLVESIFGWRIPVVHANRGAQAAVRLAHEGKTLVQDVTYACQPIRLDFAIQTSCADLVVVREVRRVLPNFRYDPQEQGRVVDGMLHHVDSFPLRPIGPVQWVVASEPLLFREEAMGGERSSSSDKKLAYLLYLFVHASIRDEALECLQQWAKPGQGPVSMAVLALGVPGGMACLSLRGANAMTTFQSARAALGCVPQPNADVVPSNHGTLLSFPPEPQPVGDARSVVYGVVHCPRDPDPPCNRGSVGIDVWCHPTHAALLLVALVVRGGACPIGIVEQAHLALEADPPAPLFPRDYVDTKAGTSYWTAETSDWRLYRSCLEAGSGRVSVSDNGPVRPVNWALVGSSSETATAAVVRGAFGLPFEQCFPTPDPDPSQEVSGRRPRRPTRSPDALVRVPPLPRERMAEHQALCHALLHSLSLPTLILCHVLVSGKGTVAAGDTIFDFNSNLRLRRPLGRVTCGAFSPCRGAYHGLAVCGASRILETMLAARSFVRTDRIPHPRGQRCRLAVRVGNVSPKLAGSLSFLF